MAGAKGKSGGARKNSGGARKNSGRKTLVLSDSLRKRIDLDMKAAARDNGGKTMTRIIADIVYDTSEETTNTDRIRAADLLMKSQLVKEDHSTIDQTITHAAPVLLPILRDNPGQIDYAAEPEEPKGEDVH